VAIATYIALIDWTDHGVQNFKDSVDRYETAQSQMRSMGVELRTSIGPAAHTTL
jgi:uncharacterized protein with GYD domain